MPHPFSPRRVSTAVRLSAAIAVACGAMVGRAEAQTERMSGPFSNLFGGGRPAANSQSLNLRTSLFGVQQKLKLPNPSDAGLLDSQFPTDDRFAGVTSSLTYRFGRQMGKSNFSIGASAFVADYSVAPDDPQYGVGANTTGGLSTQLTRRTTFNASGAANYGTRYSFSPFGTGADAGGIDIGSGGLGLDQANPLPGLERAPVNIDFIDVDARSGLGAQLSRRTSVGADVGLRHTLFFGQPQASELEIDQTTLSSSANVSHQIFRRLRFRATYRREQRLSTNGERDGEASQNVDFGLDYGDALTLQLSRRATLAVAISAGSARSLDGKTHYQLLGNVDLRYAMGRSWSSGVGYARTLGFASVFREPVLQDRGSAYVGGQLASRVGVTAKAEVSRGYVGFDTSRSFDAYSASSNLSLALSRSISAFAQYSYYRTRATEGISSVPLLSDFSRSAATVGVSLLTSLYNRPRVRQ